MPGDRPVIAVVAGATLALALAIGLRDWVNVWLATGTAALLSIAAAIGLAGPRLRLQLRPQPAAIAGGAITGLVLAGATHLAYRLAVALWPGIAPRIAILYGDLQVFPGPAAGALVLLVAVVAEELVWRGLLVELLTPRLGPGWTCAAVSALYALPQVAAQTGVLVAVAFACGVVWTALRLAARNLVVPLVSHLVWSLVIFVLAPVA